VASAPFQVGTLYLPMPWAFIVHIPAYLIGEMWIGVCVAVVVDLVPADLTASAIAIYFFVIQLIGGNINVIVTPITDLLDYRLALLITFPGFYVVAAAIFVICFAVHVCRTTTSRDEFEQCVDEKQTPGDEDVCSENKSAELACGSADPILLPEAMDLAADLWDGKQSAETKANASFVLAEEQTQF
jgi:uncharacterized membrane protein YvlD (DUF360 family)